jgi:5-formyltetrahydrofolate cyclo-ligase
MQVAKKSLRMVLKGYRNQFSNAQWTRIGGQIQHHVLEFLKGKNITSVGCYINSQKNREVPTTVILGTLLEMNIKVFVPVIGADFSMDMVQVHPDSTFELNDWGIPEPISLKPSVLHIPEVMIVPMLGADFNGFRIGYGKGYYDRYFSRYQVSKIGICPQACVLNHLPVDEFDVPMDYLITENGILRKHAC